MGHTGLFLPRTKDDGWLLEGRRLPPPWGNQEVSVSSWLSHTRQHPTVAFLGETAGGCPHGRLHGVIAGETPCPFVGKSDSLKATPLPTGTTAELSGQATPPHRGGGQEQGSLRILGLGLKSFQAQQGPHSTESTGFKPATRGFRGGFTCRPHNDRRLAPQAHHNLLAAFPGPKHPNGTQGRGRSATCGGG